MLRRLAYVAVGATACFAGITVILRYFSDILPLASTEPQSVWRTSGWNCTAYSFRTGSSAADTALPVSPVT